jgi:hypothetical protein
LNWWSKINLSKKSNSAIEGNLLILKSLNKHDLDNFECVSQNKLLTLHNKLKLDNNEYNRNFKTFIGNDPKISVIENMSDLRLDGRVTLKCGNDGIIIIFKKKFDNILNIMFLTF